ncbi:MAG: 1-acyl-sn-glycerol-3-phosphate acyltransferase [Dokdonella sp.]|nr:1-acyl-sn-glycerol-3-phosphate acyltransferase [Dokdonella sp.]
MVFLVSLVPEADCVVRSGLARNPFTRGPIRATDYLCNDSGAGLIEDCIASVKSGSNLIIFPEGTRTPVDGPMRLQRGAANIAARGPCDITPVLIRCEPRSLTKGLPWWRVPPRRMQYTIRIGQDIPVAPFLAAAGGEAGLAARRITDHLHRCFSYGGSGRGGRLGCGTAGAAAADRLSAPDARRAAAAARPKPVDPF